MPMTHRRPRFLARAMIAALFAAGVLSACSILPTSGPVQIWQPPEDKTTVTATNADFTLRVDTPNTTGMLGRADIVVLPTPGQISVYKGARWSESPALLVRNRLTDAFMAAKLSAVTTDDDHFASDYTLSGNLRAFQSEYRNGSPVAVVRYDAQLRRGGSRRVLATRSFVITEQPSGTQVPQIVAAFGAADDQLAAKVVPWVIEAVQHAPARDAGAHKH